MSVRYLFSSSGEYVAFLQNGNVFAPNADWIGFTRNGNELYGADGSFIGYILDDDRVARKKREPRRPRVARPIRPIPPLRPLRPLKRLRMPRLPYPWEDVFDKGIEGIAPGGLAQTSLEELRDTDLIAADGTYLGKVTSDPYSQESLTNKYGAYGNPYNSSSIFNKYGPYGSAYSAYSPYNQYTRTPPYFSRDGQLVAYLTANEFVTPRVDPHAFHAWLQRA